ncbi:phage tail tape measure protein [Bacillus velezensis]|uniref:phage tail tape measure protein n=1 Tax=Bacillus velezensis TaxID=492670 RepID=UPI0018C4A539|nr:phage tail tape measure protein [Bacillus velezensis]
MPKGSNDLNMLLKAKVVKLKVELDAKGSKLPAQVDAISKMLKTKPVKLKVELNASVQDLNRQANKISGLLRNSKSFKPIKIGVSIDVDGSAKNIKKQLKEIHDTVNNFNKQYGKQIKEMQQLQRRSKNISNDSGLNIKTDASVQGFNNIKKYVSQLEQAEKQLRGKFGDGKGLFSSLQLKDAQGNLRGFIASLERANGVVEKVRYEWNKGKNQFQVVDRQTATNTEKMIHKSMQSLQELQRELGKTGKASKQLSSEYKELEKAGQKGTLTSDAVKAFQTRIKNAQEEVRTQKQLNELRREEARLIRDIKNATKGTGTQFTDQTRKLLADTRNAKQSNNTEAYKDVRVALKGLTDEVNKYKASQKEAESVTKQKQKALAQLTRYLRETHENEGALSRDNIKATQQMAQRAKNTKQMSEVQKQLNNMYKQQQGIKDSGAREQALQKLKNTMIEMARVTGREVTTIESRFNQLQRNIGGNLAQINSQIKTYEKTIARVSNNSAINTIQNQANSVLRSTASNNHAGIKNLIREGDVTKIKDYIAQWEKLNIATAKISTNARGVTRITTTLESQGKTARQVTYEIDTLTNKLRRLGTQEVFNRNANLGIFEQLRIAMERVPVWMTAMTAFYGSINVVKEMANQILLLDKSLTELRRVASDNISIDSIFQGAVQLSQDLGNNIHDVMKSVSELARTFGDFNERQLLAITKTATLMANVSDLTADAATNSLVGTMNAFNISAEESIHIVDALNEVDNNYAISTQQLAEGLSKGASTARTFGVTMEETVGHITAIGAVTMESGKIIGNSLKTIYSRITTVQKAQDVLENVGVKIYDESGKVNKVNDILEQLALRWNKISSEQRQNIAVQVAGRYQLSRFLALMNNWEMASKATETAINSEGSAMRENQKYMQSFEARINALKNTWTELASTVGDAVLSGGMLAAIGGLKRLAEAAITVTQTFGALPPVLLAVFLVLNKMNVFGKLKSTIMDTVTNVGRLRTEYRAVMNDSTQHVTRTRAMASAWRSVTAAEAGATAGARAWGLSMKSALISTGIGAAIVALGYGLEKLVGKYQEVKAKQEEIEKLNKKMIDSYRKSRDGMAEMINRYEELNNKTRKTKDEQEEFNKLQNDFAKQIPTTVEYVDANGKAHMKTTDAIRSEIDQVRILSQEQARLDMIKYDEKLDKQAESYGKIIEKVKTLTESQKNLEEQNGKTIIKTQEYGKAVVANQEVVDNTKAIQENKVELMMLEAEKTEALKKTTKQIGEQSKAWLEANNMISNVGDEQLGVMEDFINYNEQILRSVPNENEFKKAYNGLFSVATQIGTVFSDAYDQMAKGIKDNDPLKDTKITEIKNELDSVAKSLPESFYSLTDAQGNVVKSSNDVVNGIKEIINVSHVMASAGKGDTDELVYRLQRAGLSAEDAQGYLYRLANENDNLAIKSELASKGVDETTGSIESLSKAAMEAIDLTSTLFGYSGGELEGLKSHLQAMQLLIQTQGEAAKSSAEYKESQEAVTDFLGVTATELENNKTKYYNIIEALSKLKLSEYEMGESWSKFIKEQDLTPDEEKILLGWNGTKDIITGAVKATAEKVKPETENVKKDVENIFNDVKLTMPEVDMTKVKDSVYYVKDDINALQKKLQDFGISVNTPTGVQVFDNLMNELTMTDGKIDDTKTNMYVLRQAINTAITNPQLLSGLQTGLETANTATNNVKSNLGGLRSLVEQPTSGAPVLNPLNDALQNTKKQTTDLATEWGTTKSVLESPVNPNLAPIGQTKSVLDNTAISAQNVQTETSKAVSSGSQVSQLDGDLKIVLEKSTDVKDSVSKLNKSLDGFGDGFSTANVRKQIELLGSKVSSAKKTINSLNSSLKIKPDSASLTTYIGKLGSIAKSYSQVSKGSKSAAESQKGLSSAFKDVVNSTKAYNSALAKTGSSLGDSYKRAHEHINSYTKLMIKAYRSNADKNKDMVEVISRYMKKMVSNIRESGSHASKAMTSMANKMHKEFTSGIKKIVSSATGLPAKIGKAIRDNMSHASDAMDELAKDMVKRFKSELGIHSPSRVFEDLGYWTIKGLSNGLTGQDLKSLGKNVFDDFGGGIFDSWDMIKAYVSGDFSSIAPEGGASGWKPMIMAAAKQMGENLSSRELNGIIAQIGRESGGNQSIVQSPSVVDINTLSGNPARGLLQYIPQTFNAYKVPGHGNIYSGFDQLLAFFNNKNWRRDLPYGRSGWGPSGGRRYAKGGFITQEINNATIGEAGEEVIIPLEQYRARALSLWTKAGSKLGIDPELLKIMIENAKSRRATGGIASSSGGTFGASSADSGGGESGGGGDSGSSGIMRESIYAGIRSADGSYSITALAKSSSYKDRYKDRADLYKVNKNERTLTSYNSTLDIVEAQMNRLNKATLSYRDKLKSASKYQNLILSTTKKEITAVQKRQKYIDKRLKQLKNTSKHTTKQREEYNSLQQEYDSNQSKLASLKNDIESITTDLRAKSVEIFTDFIDEIVSKYDTALTKISDKIDDIDFKIDVANLIDPDNMKNLLNLQASKATEAQKAQATSKNKVDSLQSQYNSIAKKKGSGSAEAKKVKEELDKAKEEYEDYTLAVLNAEKDIKDTRAKVADDGIKALQDYYKNMKDMATQAIELEKEELQKAHDAKMKMYDEETEKINSVYDAKIKQMDKEKDAATYQEQLDEKNAKKAELLNKMSLISRDNSLEGRKKLADLKKELDDLNKEISDFQKERQDTLLREAMDEQKQAQLDEITKQKETEQEKHDAKLEDLDKQKEKVSKQYDDILNNDKYWAEMRNKFIQGSFTELNTELGKMKTNLDAMNKGIFDSLYNGFSGLSDAVKKQIADLYGLDVDNMIFNSKEPINDAKEVKDANKYTMTDGKVQTNKGTKVTTPKQTSPEKKPSTKKKTTPKKTTKKKTTEKKAPKVGGKVKVSASGANAYVDAYGHQVKPWSKQAKAAGVGYSQSLYLVNSKNGYGALSKTKNVKDAIAWLKLKDLVGLETGGYTGTWAGNDGKLALLHKEEQVLNKKDTKNIFDASKLLRGIADVLPQANTLSIGSKLATAGSIVNTTNIGDVTIVVENGNKKKAENIGDEVIKQLKKLGRG